MSRVSVSRSSVELFTTRAQEVHQIKQIMKSITEMKSGQNRIMEEMKTGEDQITEEMKKEMKSGQGRMTEEMNRNQEEMKEKMKTR